MQLRRTNLWCLAVILLFIFPTSEAIKISEIEPNPLGTDAKNEWIEFYSETEENLEGYKIVNNDGKEINLNGSFSGFYVHILNVQWLDNKDERVFLYKGDRLIDQTDIISDSENNVKTWSYCNKWIFAEGTKNSKNLCDEKNEEENKLNETSKSSEEKINEEIEEEPEKEIKIIRVSYKSEEVEEEPEIIYINEPKSIKNQEDKEVLFESKNEQIKKYAIYTFALFCVFVVALVMLKKENE